MASEMSDKNNILRNKSRTERQGGELWIYYRLDSMGSFLYTALWRPYYLVDCAAMIVLQVRVKTRRRDRPTGEGVETVDTRL